MNDFTLRQFFACYFHQDWDLEYDSLDAAIEDFVNHSGPQHRAAVLEYVETFLMNGDSEEFDMTLFGGFYIFSIEPPSKREFLTAIRRSIHRKMGIVDVDRNHPAMQFFGGYFHQDWKFVYDSYLDVIEDFVRQASRQQLDAVLDVVAPYLAWGSFEDFDIGMFGGNYRPEVDGISKLDFLNVIKQSIEQKRGLASQESDME